MALDEKDVLLRALSEHNGKIGIEITGRLAEMGRTRSSNISSVASELGENRTKVTALLRELAAEGLVIARPRESSKRDLRNGGYQPTEFLLTEKGLDRIGSVR